MDLPAQTRCKRHQFLATSVLVAQGYTQAAGVDYSETFAPVAKFASNQVVLALAAHNNWKYIRWM